MRNLFFAVLLISGIGLQHPALLAQPALDARADVEAVEDSDAEMNAAISTAKETLPKFLRVLSNPPLGSSNFSFKFPLNGWEHIWVYDVRRDGDHLTGRLSNVPMQESWSLNDPVRVPLSQVSDWAWLSSDGVMQGHYTTRVLLSRIDPRRAELIVQNMGWK